MTTEFKHSDFSRALQIFEEIAFAYIFGSSMNGTVNKGSDIDIAIYLLSKEKDIDLRLKIIAELENVIPAYKNYDLVILNSANSILAMQAIQGKLLFVKPEYTELYSGFYSLTCRQFEDENYWMKKQLEYRGYEVQWDN